MINWRWLSPILVFCFGMILILLSFIVYPNINDAMVGLQEATSSYSANYWGFGWITSSARLLLFLFGLGIIMVDMAVVWLKRK